MMWRMWERGVFQRLAEEHELRRRELRVPNAASRPGKGKLRIDI